MKKIMMLAAAVAMLAGCSNDLTSDLDPTVSGSGNTGSWSGEGIIVEAVAEDVTRVDTNVSGSESYLTWEVGDELTLVHGGAAYVYLAQQAGRTSTFLPKDDANALTAVDATAPVAAFYNVASVDAATCKATFDVAAEQTEGTLTNKLPLYAYAATTVVEDGKVVVTMKPLASVVEFELSASSTWNADALSLGKSSRQLYTYASAEGLVVDAATGAIDLSAATVGTTVKVNLSAMHDFATKRNVSVVVPGVCNDVTVETTEGEGDAAVTTTTTTHHAPVYQGKACVKLYKNGVENFRRTIWASQTADGTKEVDERKHVYQPLKDILDGHKNGISTAADLKALADEVNYSVETYPCGTGFCNEDGVILLNNSISLAEYTNWPGIGHNHEGTMDGVEIQFAGIFDGQGNTIEGMTITHNNDVSFAYTGYDGSEKSIPRNDVGLFGSASYHATIKNLIVKGSVDINYDAITDSDGDYMWCYAGGVVGQAFGVQLQNLTSYVNFTTTHLDCKLRVGGIAARVAQEKVDGNHHDLKNYGTINVAHSKGAKDWEIIVGGIVGNINDGGAVDINFTDCENRGQVDVVSTAVSNSGGCFGFVSRLYEKDGLFKNCDNFAKVTIASTSAGPVVGGVAGQLRHYDWEDCDNSGTVSFGSKSMVGAESYIGGVFGYTNARNAKANTDKENYAKVYIENCENSGAVKAEIECVALAGGVIGYVTWPAEVTDCTNKGTVNYSWTNATGSKTTGHVGGLIGKIGAKAGDYKDGIAIYDSVNEGVVSSDIDNNADAGWSYVGGIAGSAYGGEAVENAYGSVGAVVDGCENKGTVRCIGGLKFRTGGIVGLINRSDIFNCINSGTVQIERKGTIAKETVGGIAGFCENKYSYISGCENSGTTAILVPNSRQAGETKSNIYQCNAGICGLVGGANVTISDCTHTGVLVSSSTGIHEWDSTKNVWVVNTADSPNYEYRGAIQGVGIKNSVIKDCEIGGEIGSVNTYDATTGEFTTKEVYELVNDETSTYHWRRWVYGYTAVIDVSTCTFGN